MHVCVGMCIGMCIDMYWGRAVAAATSVSGLNAKMLFVLKCCFYVVSAQTTELKERRQQLDVALG